MAICFATPKFHQYVYGKGKSADSVHTDHKPLESILKKPLCKAPPRLQRLMLRLHPYDLDVHFVPAKYMYLADTLSRAWIPGEGNAEMEEELSRVVHSLMLNIPVSANKLFEIHLATEQDPTLTHKSGISSRQDGQSPGKAFHLMCKACGTSETNSN